MKDDIVELLKEVSNNNNFEKRKSEDFDILNDIGLDSVQIINLLIRLEDRFDIEIDFDTFDYKHISSINNICEYIVSLQKS